MTLLNYYRTITNWVVDYILNWFFRYKITRVVHHSKNFILIDKEYDLKINSNNVKERTVQTFMKKRFPLIASASLFHEYYFMHRLDYSTSGIMCIPVHKEACQVASRLLQRRCCRKYYIALIRGLPSTNVLDLDLPIGRDDSVKEIEKMCVVKEKRVSKSARTVIIVLERGLFDNYPAAKVLIRPITGRRHQIRVHCSYIGHTIVGDYTYSNKKDVKPFRMFLHSLCLQIPNEIENLDFRTSDPFDERKIRHWKPVLKNCSLDEAFTLIECYV